MVRTNEQFMGRGKSFLDNLNQLNHYAVGFDRVFDRLNDYASKNQSTSNTFPPYNIRKDGDFNFEIEMALAGFGKKDIEVEVADGVLTVRSVKDNEESDDVIHRGISYRKFVRKFTMADDIVVNSAKLQNGLLHISLERIVPEEKKPRLIDIK